MFRGEKINVTEKRAVLHVALRAPRGASIVVDGENVVPEVHAVLDQMADFAEPRPQRRVEGPHRQAHPQRRQHRHRRLRPRAGDGLRGAAATTATATLTFRFVSNVDGTDFAEATRDLDPAETLFIISSKTFTTLETMTNAARARDWSLAGLGGDDDGGRQALRRRLDQRRRRCRSSASTRPTCSASGTGSAAATRWTRRSASRRCSPSAPSNFRAMLAGFHEMDEHFRTAPFERNLPVLMGLLAVWYNDFFGAQTVAVLPYEQYLKRFPAYLQQLTMESNGKHVTLDGARVDYRHRPDLLGRARHQRPAFVLPADPPGDAADPLRLHRLRRVAQPARPAPRHAAGQRLRADRGAGLRQDGRAR